MVTDMLLMCKTIDLSNTWDGSPFPLLPRRLLEHLRPVPREKLRTRQTLPALRLDQPGAVVGEQHLLPNGGAAALRGVYVRSFDI